jgi:hypothetical protein
MPGQVEEVLNSEKIDTPATKIESEETIEVTN